MAIKANSVHLDYKGLCIHIYLYQGCGKCSPSQGTSYIYIGKLYICVYVASYLAVVHKIVMEFL